MREKLIELLRIDPCPMKYPYSCFDDCKYNTVKNDSGNCFEERYADHLIANGVTVQRWIPVTERLPEDGQIVLTCKNGICEVQTYEARRNGWVSGRFFWSMAFVTHWMPLPQPPKGE